MDKIGKEIQRYNGFPKRKANIIIESQNSVSEIKNSLGAFNSTLDKEKERISEIK